MSVSVTYLPNTSSHAWLMQLERNKQQAIGPLAYPLPQASTAFAVRIEQFIGFAFEPRARFEHTEASLPLLTWNDFGVFAPLGPLPLHTTEDMLSAHRSEALSSFVSAVTQRLFHLYYQSWASMRPEHERTLPQDGFQSLLHALGGAPTLAQGAHLAWHKPTLPQLQMLVQKHMQLKIKVHRTPWLWIANDKPCRLGHARLCEAILGARLRIFGHGDVHIAAYPTDAKDYAELRNTSSPRRAALQRLIRLCIGDTSGVHIETVAPKENWRKQLGDARLGTTKLQPH